MINRLTTLLACVVLAAGFSQLMLSTMVWLRLHPHIPILDTLHLLPFVQSIVQEGFWSVAPADWFSPFAGAHRIFLTRALMVIDFKWFGGKNHIIYLSTLLSIAALFFLYVRAAVARPPKGRLAYCFVAGICLIFLCSPTQYWNLINPINASWYTALALSAVAVWILVSEGQKLSGVSCVTVCLCAAGAALSNFAGVMVCLMLPALALLYRTQLWPALLLFTITFLWAYLQGMGAYGSGLENADEFRAVLEKAIAENPEMAREFEFFNLWKNRIRSIIHSVGLVLGTPMSSRHPTLALIFVASSAVFLAYHWLILIKNWITHNNPAPNAQVFFLTMATICLGITCAIPMGRMLLFQPTADRYQTITMIYWLSVICLMYTCGAHVTEPRKRLAGISCLGVVTACLLLGGESYSTKRLTSKGRQAVETQIIAQLGSRMTSGSSIELLEFGPEDYSDHVEFLSGYGFTPSATRTEFPVTDRSSGPECTGISAQLTRSRWPELSRVNLSFREGINPLIRRMSLHGRDGGSGSLFALMLPTEKWNWSFKSSHIWTGYYRGAIPAPPDTLLINIPGFTGSTVCAVPHSSG